MRGLILATPEQLQKYMRIIVGLHTCDTYCKYDFLGLFHMRFTARGYEHAASLVASEFESVGQEEPLVVGEKTSDGIFQFHFAQPADWDELVGTRIFHFRPPPLCPSKLIKALQYTQLEGCPPKQGRRLLH